MEQRLTRIGSGWNNAESVGGAFKRWRTTPVAATTRSASGLGNMASSFRSTKGAIDRDMCPGTMESRVTSLSGGGRLNNWKLITVCDACHRSIHRTQDAEIAFARDYAAFQGAVTESLQIPHRRGCKLTGRPVQVERVEYVGLRQTYDLSVEVPWHNFVANGIVVHNSFNEESARYHQLEGDFYVPSPQAVRTQVGKPGAYTFEPAEETVATDTIDTFRRVYGQLYDEYLALVGKGVAKELARSLLPFGIYTQFYWTLNARSLMNFLALRNSPSAQYEIRIYAQAVEQLFAGKMPVTHACFEEFGRNVP